MKIWSRQQLNCDLFLLIFWWLSVISWPHFSNEQDFSWWFFADHGYFAGYIHLDFSTPMKWSIFTMLTIKSVKYLFDLCSSLYLSNSYVNDYVHLFQINSICTWNEWSCHTRKYIIACKTFKSGGTQNSFEFFLSKSVFTSHIWTPGENDGFSILRNSWKTFEIL